jgi:hypothetical protein
LCGCAERVDLPEHASLARTDRRRPPRPDGRPASKSRTLTGQSLEIENRKYASGTSSNLAIAKAQNDLASAELAELVKIEIAQER